MFVGLWCLGVIEQWYQVLLCVVCQWCSVFVGEVGVVCYEQGDGCESQVVDGLYVVFFLLSFVFGLCLVVEVCVVGYFECVVGIVVIVLGS